MLHVAATSSLFTLQQSIFLRYDFTNIQLKTHFGSDIPQATLTNRSWCSYDASQKLLLRTGATSAAVPKLDATSDNVRRSEKATRGIDAGGHSPKTRRAVRVLVLGRCVHGAGGLQDVLHGRGDRGQGIRGRAQCRQ